MHQSSSL